LWKAYRLAEDKPQETIPKTIFWGKKTSPQTLIKHRRVRIFSRITLKTLQRAQKLMIQSTMENNRKQLQKKNFTVENVTETMRNFKDKCFYRFDNIPVRILRD